MKSPCCNSIRTTTAAASAAALLTALFVFITGASAQEKQWKEYRMEEPPRVRGDVMRDLRDGVVRNASFDDYWKYRIAEFTFAENGDSLPDKRKRLKNELRMGRRGAAHDKVNELVMGIVPTMIADGELAPVVRINLALVLGDLNRDEGRPPGELPVPLNEAIPELLKLLDPNRPVDSVNDSLRVAALVGINRHVRLRMDPSSQERVLAALAVLLQQGDPPQQRNADVHGWILRLAARAAGNLGTPGRDRGRAELLDAMLAIVGNPGLTYRTRCEVARSMGQIDFRLVAADYDYARAVNVLGNLVSEFSQKVSAPRAMLLYLHCSHAMLNGPEEEDNRTSLLDAVSETHKPQATELNRRIEEMLALVDVREIDELDETVMSRIADLGKQLGDSLKGEPDGEKVEVGRAPASDPVGT